MNLNDEVALPAPDDLSEVDQAKLPEAEIIVSCRGNAPEVLKRTKEILRQVLTSNLELDSPIDEWEKRIPTWFLDSCVSEPTGSEIQELLKTEKGFDALSNMWTLAGFLYWFRPELRSWYWWDGVLENSNILIIKLKVSGFPLAWGALQFLLKSAGAESATLR